VNPALSGLERTVLPGTRLGRYEIITHLASGGMATVFLGRVLGVAGFHRLVAIKLLHSHVASNEQFITMFLDEARLAARIRHANVVPTLDLQHGPEGHYLVMEFVEGDSLLGLLRESVKIGKPLPPGIAIRIVLDVLAGLHAAHELVGDGGEPLNLVHRDVSPHNILVGVDGIARIVDFGIARAEERIGTTRDGQVKGKLAYMAPEQTTAEPVDRRVDVFSAGIVLWESLTGRRLFRGQSDAEVLRKLLDRPIPRLREVSPAYPQALDDVCARALERAIGTRFNTAADFAEALEQAAEQLDIATPKQVGVYVRETAGAVIDNLMGRARAFQEGSKALPPIPRLELTDNPDSSVRVSATPMGVASTAPHFAASQLAGGEPRTLRARRPIVVGVAAALLVLVGAIIATVTLLVASSSQAPSNSAASSALPIHATIGVSNATASSASAVATAVAATPTSDPVRRPPSVRKVLPMPSASTAAVVLPSATSTATTPPVTPPTQPTSSAFNPESM
jgi:serine/threonine-protein kinase